MARVRQESPADRQRGAASATDDPRDIAVQRGTTFRPQTRCPVPTKMGSSKTCRRCSHTWTQKLYTLCCPSAILKVIQRKPMEIRG